MICSPLLAKQYLISRTNGDRRSQIEKHVVVSAFSAGRRFTKNQTSIFDFVNLEKTTGESIANAIIWPRTTSMWRLQDRGQASDDASAMSSEASGVKEE